VIEVFVSFSNKSKVAVDKWDYEQFEMDDLLFEMDDLLFI